MDLKTLADVRTLLGHLPKEAQAKSTWQHVEAALKQAATGGDTTQVSIAVQMALMLEGVEYRLKWPGHGSNFNRRMLPLRIFKSDIIWRVSLRPLNIARHPRSNCFCASANARCRGTATAQYSVFFPLTATTR
jgi:hypothetical protein